MTTLLGDELFDYLTHLESEVQKIVSTSTNGSLQQLMNSQMKGIISAEIKFLKYINANGTQSVLSISPNGLPSVASLNPDLEKMCELEEQNFGSIPQRYQKGVDGKDEGNLYITVSEEKWNAELKSRKQEKLSSKIGFAVSETEEGKFELALKEELYLKKGYDQFSKEHPLLVREGKMWYHALWNRLIDNSKESFYVPNTAVVLNGESTVLVKPNEKPFNVIKRMGENVYYPTSNFAKNFVKGVIFAPTSIRKLDEYDKGKCEMPESSGFGMMGGVLGSACFPFIGYPLLICLTGGIGTAIVGAHFATNLASGLYEWYRHEKNKGGE